MALRELNEHPETIFTVITGEGRFFSSGADVKATAGKAEVQHPHPAAKKIDFMASISTRRYQLSLTEYPRY